MKKEKMAIRRIPIYSVFFMLNVSHDLVAARNDYIKYFGPVSIDVTGCGALSSSSGHNFGVFLQIGDQITHGNIAHEVMHTTNHIMEWVGHDISSGNHEPHCYLCGYLTEMVYKQLKEWKIKIT